MLKSITQVVIQALVDDREQVNVSCAEGRHTLVLKVSVGKGEAGKVIGKQGRTINALRTILNAAAAKEKKRVILEIVNDGILLESPGRQLPVQSNIIQIAVR